MMKFIKNYYQIILYVFMIIALVYIDQSNIKWSSNELASKMIENSILRFIGGIVFLTILLSYGYGKYFKFTAPVKSLLIIIPGLIVAVNNFPISAFFQDRTVMIEPAYNVYLFLIESLSVGFFEEIIFRVLILVLLLEQLKDKAHGILKAIIISSLLFGVIHIINFFDGAAFGATMMQIGYSFLVGLLLAVLYIKTKNIWVIMILHALYNFFGQVMFQVGTVSNRYDTITVVATVIIGALCAVYGAYLYIGMKNRLTFDID